MKVVAIVGPGNTEEVTDRLVERLADSGTVGLVSVEETDSATDRGHSSGEPAASLQREVDISEDGQWTLSGESTTVEEMLDRLTPDCDYAIVEGAEDVALPTIVVGDQSERAAVLESGATPGDIDVDGVVDALATVDPYETLESLVARVKESADESYAGAIATFTGRVRAKDHADDEYTEQLEFERYDGVAEEKTQRIRDELEGRDGIYEVLLHHKTGVVEAGEDIVFVVVLAGHRTEAFRTVEDGINRLKEEVPLFKKEVTVEDEYWAHTGTRE
jgi:molybdopterin synthase catalytic subunit